MTDSEQGSTRWAEQTFGAAQLGDIRRTKRLVQLASAAARRPHAHITRVFEGSPQMHVAYDFVENDAVSPMKMIDAMGEATACAAAGLQRVFVATDGSSINVTDKEKKKGTGRIGSNAHQGRGDKVHSALAIDEQGAPIGLVDLQFWQRTGPSKKAQRDSLSADQKETQRWLDARQSTRERLQKCASGVRPHFLHDREADAWPILFDAVEHRETEDSTIRANWDRRIVPDAEGDDETSRLRDVLKSTPLSGTYELKVSAAAKRAARTAVMQVRAAPVTLRLRDKRTEQIRTVRLDVVHALEVDTVPKGEKPIEWLLYTTRTISTFDDAVVTVQHYTYRWRIEEFHRAWKLGGSDAESTQLSGENRTRWLIILAAVAVRAVRLSYLARTDPERDPRRDFDDEEIQALQAIVARQKRRSQTAMTIAVMVKAIASLGGYVQQKSNPNPGPQTLILGLTRLADIVLGARIATGISNEGSRRSRQ